MKTFTEDSVNTCTLPSICWAPDIKMDRRGFRTYLGRKKPYPECPQASPGCGCRYAHFHGKTQLSIPGAPSCHSEPSNTHTLMILGSLKTQGHEGLGFAVSAVALPMSPPPPKHRHPGPQFGKCSKNHLWRYDS